VKVANVTSNGLSTFEHVLLAQSTEVQTLIRVLEKHCAENKRDAKAKRLLKTLTRDAECW
jgi:ribosomal protein S15P/S13E